MPYKYTPEHSYIICVHNNVYVVLLSDLGPFAEVRDGVGARGKVGVGGRSYPPSAHARSLPDAPNNTKMTDSTPDAPKVQQKYEFNA
jgi:hypothetical protein